MKKQTFMKSWIGWILIAAFIFPIFGIYQELSIVEDITNESASKVTPILTILFTITILVGLLMLRLKTEINEYQIKINFFPFANKSIPWSEVQSAKVLNYGFVGGWGS